MHVPSFRNHPLRRVLSHSLDQVSWLPGYLLARLPMGLPHSGPVSIRARYSCGNSSLTAFPFSKEGLSRSMRSAHIVGSPYQVVNQQQGSLCRGIRP